MTGAQDAASHPLLTVVTGRPASGKSTLSHKIAHAIRCPLIARDEIKEGLVNTLNQHDTDSTEIDVGLHVFNTFFNTVEFLLKRHITLVAEAAFQHKLWSPKLEPLREIARLKVIVCTVDVEVAKSRFVERGKSDPDRAKFHDDWAAQNTEAGTSFLDRPYDPPKLDVPTLSVDTSDGYNPPLDAVIAFIKQR